VKRNVMLLAALMSVMMALTGPAFAGHAHYLDTQRGTCVEDVARGQTRISDEDHGGYHRFHENVHKGTSEDPATPGEFAFAQDSNPVSVNKGTCPAG